MNSKIDFLFIFLKNELKKTENERKLSFAEKKHRLEVEEQQRRTAEALARQRLLEQRLQDSGEALAAASRLSETLDQKEDLIRELRRESKPNKKETGVNEHATLYAQNCIFLASRVYY